MPELPEVEAIARALRPLVTGQTIRRCEVLHPIAARPSSGRGRQAAIETLRCGTEGRTIETAERRGKYLLLTLDHGCIVMHFRLDGQLVWFDSRQPTGHIDVAFDFTRGTLGFVDRRHLGRVGWAARPEDAPGIASLGVDPLSKEFTAKRLEAMLSGSRRPLKLFLLDQTRIAGLGNIYSSEAMWRARLDPRRRAHRFASLEARALHKGIVDVLRGALEWCLHPAPDFRNPEWWFGDVEKILRVYDREGQPCRRCGSRIRRIEQGGRFSYYCPRCQR